MDTVIRVGELHHASKEGHRYKSFLEHETFPDPKTR